MNDKSISPMPEMADAPLPRPSPPPLPYRVLLVEDDSVIRRFNAEALTDSGYAVDVAEDGAVAWDTLQLNRYDLMVTDNQMPKVSGVELMGKVHGARIVLLIILATGTAPDFTLYPWPKPAATLLKPYTTAELVTTVMEVLDANDGALGTRQAAPADAIRNG